MGLDGVEDGVHACTVTALEDGEVCAIPYRRWLEVCGNGGAGLRERMHRMLGVELARARRLKLLLTLAHAEPRVAAFLLMISARMAARGYSPFDFQLRMSRADIGSYLGLTLETVSRSLSALDRHGWIEVSKKHVHLLCPEQLAALCEAEVPGSGVPRITPHRGRDVLVA